MKRIILSTIFITLSAVLFAQSIGQYAPITPKNSKKTNFNTNTLRKNTFSVEGAGQNGAGAGFSYQRFIWGNYKTYVSGSVGVGIPVSLQNNAKVSTQLLCINQNVLFNFGNFNGKGSYGEIGFGSTYGSAFNNSFNNSFGGSSGKASANNTLYSVYPMLGYRFQPSASRLFLHLYFMPIFGESRTTANSAANDVNAASATCLDCPIPDNREAVRPWGGFGAGYTF